MTFDRIGTAGPGPAFPYPSSTAIGFTTPQYKEVDLIRSDNEWKTRTEWKPTQHYKRWMVSNTLYLVGVPFTLRTADLARFYVSKGGAHPNIVYSDPVPISKFGQFGEHTLGLPTMLQADTGDGFVPKPANLNALVDNSLRAMLPTIKAELSLVNSLIELKDFRSLPETLSRLKAFWGNLPSRTSLNTKFFLRQMSRPNRRIKQSFKNAYGPSIAELTGSTANGYLQNAFNVMPLLSDLQGIYTAMVKMHRQINDFVSRQGKRQVRHFTVRPSYSEIVSQQSTSNQILLDNGQFGGTFPAGLTSIFKQNNKSGFLTREYYPEYISEFHAQVEYTYTLTRFQIEHARILGILDMLGVNMNPSIWWNALPWTFVIDWVANVSRWLDDRKHINMEPEITIHRYLWSYKSRRRIRLRIIPQSSPTIPGYNWPDTYLPDLYEETYRRDVGIPSSTQSPFLWSWLSLKEATLGVALAITRLKRFKPRGW
jgi:hypothetical protein